MGSRTMPPTSLLRVLSHPGEMSRLEFEAHGTDVNSRAHVTIDDRDGRTLRARGGHEPR